jgi:Lipopolysaccharide biosynthesis protein
MGPLYPFEEMFDCMNQKDVDFWGITLYHGAPFDPFNKIKYGYLPLHIQSHFIVIRNHMLESIEFKKYWDNRPLITSYEEAICWHEAIFTKIFSDMGFKWDVYVDTRDLLKHSYCPILMSPLELIKNRKCPIIKRRSFFHNYNDFLAYTNGESTIEAYEYVKENMSYNTDLIWQNVLRTENQADIKSCLQLNYILPSRVRLNNLDYTNKKIALVLHIYFVDLIEYCLQYALSMPQQSDIYITTDSEEKKQVILSAFSKLIVNSLDVLVIPNRGRDISALLIATKPFIMDYDYVCFAHDKKVSQLDMGIKGESFSYKCFQNILKTDIYVENIISTFEENPRLGLLTPPPPEHGDYYTTLGITDWGSNYKNTVNLAKLLNINISMNKNKEPIAPLGTMFWFRPCALKPLFDYNWSYEKFPKEPNDVDGTLLHAIERIYPFIAQQQGFYPAWVMCDTYAKIEITDLYYMLRKLNITSSKLYGDNSFNTLINTMENYITGLGNKKETDRLFRYLIKEKLRRFIPHPIWIVCKSLYRVLHRKNRKK